MVYSRLTARSSPAASKQFLILLIRCHLPRIIDKHCDVLQLGSFMIKPAIIVSQVAGLLPSMCTASWTPLLRERESYPVHLIFYLNFYRCFILTWSQYWISIDSSRRPVLAYLAWATYALLLTLRLACSCFRFGHRFISTSRSEHDVLYVDYNGRSELGVVTNGFNISKSYSVVLDIVSLSSCLMHSALQFPRSYNLLSSSPCYAQSDSAVP